MNYYWKTDGRQPETVRFLFYGISPCQYGLLFLQNVPRSLAYNYLPMIDYKTATATPVVAGEHQVWFLHRSFRSVDAACGGTHRMMGFSYAVRKREQRGEPIQVCRQGAR